MRIACSLGSLLSVEEVLQCAQLVAKTKIDSIWIPETWGMENFSMLGAVANNTETPVSYTHLTLPTILRV